MIASVGAVLQATEDQEIAFALQSAIIAAIEAKIAAETKKPKKGEEVKPFDIGTLELTNDLCNSLPHDILRNCVRYILSTKLECSRFGYVLDVWEYGIAGSIEDFQSMLCGETPSQANNESDGIAENAAAKSSAFPELVVEIQVVDAVVIKRLSTSLGIPDGGLAKASKDNQATIKALDAQLAAYSAILQPHASDASIGRSHPIVQRLEAAGSSSAVLRINGESDLDSLVVDCIAKLREVHGVLGWIASSGTDASIEAENDTSSLVVIQEDPIMPSSSSKDIAAHDSGLEKHSYQALNYKLRELSGDDLSTLKTKCQMVSVLQSLAPIIPLIVFCYFG